MQISADALRTQFSKRPCPSQTKTETQDYASFDADPLRVVTSKGHMVTAQRPGKSITRDSSYFKHLPRCSLAPDLTSETSPPECLNPAPELTSTMTVQILHLIQLDLEVWCEPFDDSLKNSNVYMLSALFI